jgi:hypothetical protein
VTLNSDADPAYILFKKLLEDGALFRQNDPQLSEADTRAKLIDPVFRDVLGWAEPEIRREKPANGGFADYIMGAESAYLLVEAKRTNPRFRLESSDRPRKLKLSGPHLLGQKKLKPFIDQAQGYASSLGAQFAILTNGSQYIIFKPYLPGRSWITGTAIVFHNYDDIVQDFAHFFKLLSRDNVCAGLLLEEFEQIEGLTSSLFAPIQFIHDPDYELVRNPFWSKISRVIGPLLIDAPEEPEVQAEIIANCYVATALSDEADASLDRKLRDTMPKLLSDAGVRDVAVGSGKASVFGRELESDVTAARPGTYILTGGVGSGKTTFLRRFASKVARGFVREYCIWLHIDFLTIGNVDPQQPDSAIHHFVYKSMREALSRSHPAKIPHSGEEIRALFAIELHAAERTKLYNIPRDSPE